MIFEAIVVVLATARLTRLVTTDSLSDGFRTYILRRWPTTSTVFGDTEIQAQATNTLGQRVGSTRQGVEVIRVADGWYATTPAKWSELVECHWCLGFWLSILTLSAWYLYPVSLWVMAPFAVSYAVGWLNDRH